MDTEHFANHRLREALAVFVLSYKRNEYFLLSHRFLAKKRPEGVLAVNAVEQVYRVGVNGEKGTNSHLEAIYYISDRVLARNRGIPAS